VKRHLLCFGFGYSARALVRALGPDWSITGTSRDAEPRAVPVGTNFGWFRFDCDHPLKPTAFAGVTHILISVPPDEGGDPVFDRHRDDIAAISGLAWLGYLSTTGVYGDRDGGWVDERAELRPSGARGRRRAAAEAAWLGLWRGRGVPVRVFRLAGIYGPGRSPFRAACRNGKAHRQAGSGVLAHPCRRHRQCADGVDRATTPPPSTMSAMTAGRLRRCDRPCRQLLGVAPAAGAVRGGRAVADGASFYDDSRSASRTR
jgi:nucleoside-diphosphate-sugar epimerase